jgi:hypothetical protein
LLDWPTELPVFSIWTVREMLFCVFFIVSIKFPRESKEEGVRRARASIGTVRRSSRWDRTTDDF